MILDIEKIMILFAGFLVAVAFPFLVMTSINHNMSIQTNDDTVRISDSCEAAMTAVGGQKRNPFEKKEDREKAISVFFDNLERSNWGTQTREYLMHSIACIILVDVDGFYVWSNYEISDNGEAILYSGISTKNTYSEFVGNSIIQFSLDDYVTVINTVNGKNNINITGNRKQVLKMLADYTGENTAEYKFINANNFKREKKRIIIEQLTKQANYWINKNNRYNFGDVGYELYIPTEGEGSFSSRTLSNPGIYAFYQGKQIDNADLIYNSYTMAGYEKTQEKEYYAVTETNGRKVYYEKKPSGKPIDFVGSMDLCASRGYSPDPESVIRYY